MAIIAGIEYYYIGIGSSTTEFLNNIINAMISYIYISIFFLLLFWSFKVYLYI